MTEEIKEQIASLRAELGAFRISAEQRFAQSLTKLHDFEKSSKIRFDSLDSGITALEEAIKSIPEPQPPEKPPEPPEEPPVPPEKPTIPGFQVTKIPVQPGTTFKTFTITGLLVEITPSWVSSIGLRDNQDEFLAVFGSVVPEADHYLRIVSV